MARPGSEREGGVTVLAGMCLPASFGAPRSPVDLAAAPLGRLSFSRARVVPRDDFRRGCHLPFRAVQDHRPVGDSTRTVL